ncbi:MAG: hypothetical protein JWN72_675, partial [Thermoleophilia bacterium]|nr:hypothetical protein [Thermoleophilia bacterium]
HARAADHAAAARSLGRAASKVPRARADGTCATTASLPGQGATCRTGDGLYVLPGIANGAVTTHGPDLVDPSDAAAVLASRRASRAAAVGSRANVICSSPARTRYVALIYLLPSDYASGSPNVHGDRFTEVSTQLRQALYDAAAIVDTRAGELAPGTRRRMRVLCDPDGQPTVRRIVLPGTADSYRSAANGFEQMYEDLQTSGDAPEFANFYTEHAPSLRRLLGYYDADFLPGYAGQGTLYRRSSLLKSVKSADPIVSRTTRNINNNPPIGSLAVQYGTRGDGVTPDPPLPTSLLHELSHTMGAVQDEPPTSSGAGHCIDGVDVMCYDDQGPRGASFVATACPDPAPPEEDADEVYDCNGDTYFNPAPAPGSPLSLGTTWQLGLAANETLSTDTSAAPEPPAISAVRVGGRGTSLKLTWTATAAAKGRLYEVSGRVGSEPWSYVGSSSVRSLFATTLRPGAHYELAVAAVDVNGDRGPGVVGAGTTGADTSAPARVTGVARSAVARSYVRLRWNRSTDNARVTSYRVERLVGRTWQRAATVSGLGTSATITGPVVRGLTRGTTYTWRIRAFDARGNASLPSSVLRIATSR